MGGCGLALSGLQKGLLVRCCEQSNES